MDVEPEFRLPDAARPAAVSLEVSDLRRSIDFYERVLGLRVCAAAGDHATLGPPGARRPFITLHTRPGVKPAQRGALGLFHFAILLPDRAALGRFASHFSRLPIQLGMGDHLVSEALYLSDPDGLGIEIYSDRPRSEWRYRDGELVMTTDALDIADVIAAAGSQPWTGMPSDAMLGHLHFHVGSLGEAEAFYHRALGFDKMVWSYPGALFLAAGGYHHHVAANIWSRGPAPAPDRARLLDWELLVPSAAAVAAIGDSLRSHGYSAEAAPEGLLADDPWGTRVRVVPA